MVYRGAGLHVFLESGGLPLIGFVQNDAGAASGWSPGEAVAVRFQPDSVVVLVVGAVMSGGFTLGRRGAALALLGPPLALFLAFFVAPLASLFWAGLHGARRPHSMPTS